MTKRSLAAEWTAEGLINASSGRATLWTFTTPCEIDPRTMGSMWNLFLVKLKKYAPDVRYFRVLEPHKSATRFHLHVIFDRRFDHEWLAILARSCGWGHLWVSKISGMGAASYVSKYLAKAKRIPSLKGVRLWSCSRGSPGRVLVSEVEVRFEGRTFREWVGPWMSGRSWDEQKRAFRRNRRIFEFRAWSRVVDSWLESCDCWARAAIETLRWVGFEDFIGF